MAHRRKTVDVETLKNKFNTHLARTDEYATKEFKAAICTVLEEILHESNQYNGFFFLGEDPSVNDPDYYDRKYF